MTGTQPRDVGQLFPPIEPYRYGYLPVTDGHEIYWEECGHPHGQPVLVLHGGPGGGCEEEDRCYFDPTVWRIILFDQRGCGRSRPLGCLEANTTQDLVADISRLLDHLKIDRIALSGYSWGSTLALVYAITNPERVTGMVFGGVYLGTDEEDEISFRRSQEVFPHAWQRLISHVPQTERDQIIEYYHDRMVNGSPDEQERYAYEWSRYELSITSLEPSTDEEIEEELSWVDYRSSSLIETFYFRHHCFLDPDYILNRLERLPRVPMTVIHGQYDVVCPPMYIQHVVDRLRNLGHDVDFQLIVAGHDDHRINERFVEANAALFQRLTSTTTPT